MLSIAGFALALLWGGVTSRSGAVDPIAVDDALAVRAGPRADAWTILIEPAEDATVRVQLRHAGGDELIRTYVLVGTTVEERSRELAAALALVLEQHQAVPRDATRPASAPEVPARIAPVGWIAAGGRVAAGRPADPDFGASLRGGLLWGRRILQPVAQLGSSHARRGSLRLDGVRLGVGLAVGAPWQRWWFGGAVVPQLVWLRARDRANDDAFGSATELTAMAQWRSTSGLLLAARAGAEVAAPPLRAVGKSDHLRFAPVRFVAGLEIGIQLPIVRHR